MTERGAAQLFDETPAELGRLVLLTYAFVLPPLAQAILAALVPWAAVLFEPGVVAVAWGAATLGCLLVARHASGVAVGAACTSAFAALQAVLVFVFHGKARRREALARVKAEVEDRERILASHDLRSPRCALALSAHALERPAKDPGVRAALAEDRLSNALGGAPGGGSVALAVVRTSGAIAFSVRRGPFLPVDIAPRLFQPYQRRAGARYKGAGLGLAISRGIVEGHGGRIWAEPARGSRTDLRFTLPLETADRSTPCAPSPS